MKDQRPVFFFDIDNCVNTFAPNLNSANDSFLAICKKYVPRYCLSRSQDIDINGPQARESTTAWLS